MALIDCNFYSDILGVDTTVKVILPERSQTKIGALGSLKKEKYPTLYLLHGLSDDHTAWTRKTSIERYVDGKGLAVVMPDVGRSFYTDMKFGGNYWTFISEELPKKCREFFPLSEKREDNFVAGLSMGGYGAFKLALNCPEKFKAAASLSGAVDLLGEAKNSSIDGMMEEMKTIFGSVDEIEKSINDLFYVAKKLSKSNTQTPYLYQWCGTEDFLHNGNLNFKKFIEEETRIKLSYSESHGDHKWCYWDEQIQKVIKDFGF
jgi:S-formylglutathione hydrolase FrmB